MTTWDDDANLHRSGTGEPLLLLHGITSTWHAWKPVIPALAERYDVVALTLPGHLGWPWPEGTPATVAAMADLVMGRLAELGIENPHLAGNSLGGWIGLELGARRLVRSVTAFSPAGGWTEPHDVAPFFVPGQQRVSELRPSAEEILGDPDRRRRLLTTYLENGDRIPVDEAVRMWDGVLATVTLVDMLKAFNEPVRTPVPAELPVGIVWGNQEKLLPEFFGAPGWHDAAPGAVWSHLETGHMPMYDDPEGVVAEIEKTTARA